MVGEARIDVEAEAILARAAVDQHANTGEQALRAAVRPPTECAPRRPEPLTLTSGADEGIEPLTFSFENWRFEQRINSLATKHGEMRPKHRGR